MNLYINKEKKQKATKKQQKTNLTYRQCQPDSINNAETVTATTSITTNDVIGDSIWFLD